MSHQVRPGRKLGLFRPPQPSLDGPPAPSRMDLSGPEPIASGPAVRETANGAQFVLDALYPELGYLLSMKEKGRKPLSWLGDSLDTISTFPPEVKKSMGHAIHLAQIGMKAVHAKPMSGFGGASILEIVEDDDGSTYRVVYTVKFREVVYVLHAFQKKSAKGIATPKHHIDLIRQRLQVAVADHGKRFGGQETMSDARKSSGNVFADLGIENPEEYLAKSNLAAQIQVAIEACGLTQKQAGALIGISQPNVSDLLRGRLDGFSTERLFRFLTLLGRNVRISVTKARTKQGGHVSVFPSVMTKRPSGATKAGKAPAKHRAALLSAMTKKSLGTTKAGKGPAKHRAAQKSPGKKSPVGSIS
jgi:phage-related protein/predicted XRE-type DNA-binding protein